MAGFVKICGTTSLADARLAIEAGADAVGFVFAASPRRIEPAAAREIVRQLPKGVLKVGAFVNAAVEEIKATADFVGLDAVQLHGSESADTAGELRRWAIIKAVQVNDRAAVDYAASWRPYVHSLLLDSGNSSQPGGTGRRFDWARAALFRELAPIIIAGGLTPANVAEAIAITEPYGVDVVSGVEATPGRKDPERVRNFVNAARAAFRHRATAHAIL
jgi:phosphoribosylanthranilate isomerase